MSPFCGSNVPKTGTKQGDGTRARDREKGHVPVPFPVPFSRPNVPLITFADVAAIWSYDPNTGFLRWEIDAGPRTKAGTLIGAGSYSNYVVVGFNGRSYKAHRLAWMLYWCTWPKHEIDHINGVRWDNRIANLRDVPHRVNQMNQKCHRREATQ